MAQTIALQRGTVSTNLNGNTSTTLFTQSGGTATRVIIGGVGMYTNTSTGSLAMQLVVGLSGSTTNTIVIAFKGSSTALNTYSMDFIPGLMPTSGAMRPSTNSTPSGTSILSNNSANVFSGSQSLDGAYITGADTATNFGNNTFNYEYCPAQFWMGPSDTLFFRGRNSNGAYTGNVAYSFTTITES